MTTRIVGLLSYFVVLAVSVHGQATLPDAIQRVKAQLGTVKVGNAQYEQQLETSKAPYRLTFQIKQTDNKGKVNTETYHLNVADLDPGLVIPKPAKDVVTVTASVRRSRKLIRYTENNKPGNFTERLTLYAQNLEAASELAETLRNLAKIAEKSYQPTVLPDSYESLALWLKTNVGDETVGTSTYKQTLIYDGHNPLVATLTQNAGKEDDQYTVNVADISPNDLKLNAKGEQLILTLPVRNRSKFIRYSKSGKTSDVVNTFDIMGTDVDRMRDIEAAWRKLIPLAETRLESQRPALQTMEDVQKAISAGVQSVSDNKEPITQKIRPDCDCILTQTKGGNRSLSEEIYRFSLDDLADNAAKISTSGGLFTLTLSTGKQRLISVSKNQVRQNHVSEIEIVSGDLETIRYLPEAFSKAAQLCRQVRKSPVPTNSATSTLSWLSGQMPSLRSENEELKLILEPAESNTTCSLKLTERLSGRKAQETSYDIPLKNISASGVDMSINGRNVFVNLPTNGKEKLIKTVKDGKPSDNVNTVRIQLDDIEKARYVAEAFRQLIRQCAAN